MLNNRYIPDNSQPVQREGLAVIVYTYTAKDGKPAAVAYVGKSNKPYFHYRFMTDEQRQKEINDLFSDAARRAEFYAERKASRTSFKHSLKPGDILTCSWGYDQTNIQFYKIIATTEKTATFREVKQIRGPRGMGGLGDSWDTMPDVNNFRPEEKEYTRKVNPGNCINFSEYPGGMQRRLSPWDGRPEHASDGH